MKIIPLTRGYEVMVDDNDYSSLSQWKWFAVVTKSGHCYAARTRRKKEGQGSRLILMHRQLLVAPRELEVDHRDSNGLNNCRGNLRLVTHHQNMRNRRKLKPSSSQYKGVRWDKTNKRWIADLYENNCCIWKHSFKDEREAAEAWDVMSLSCFGEYARTNASLGLFT